MIRVVVSGDTWDMKRTLYDNGFRYLGNRVGKWIQVLPETSLDAVCDAIRPPHSYSHRPPPRVIVSLSWAVMSGETPAEVRVRLKSTPSGKSILSHFKRETGAV